MDAPEIDLDEIMENIRQKVEGRKAWRPEPDDFVLERPGIIFLTFRPVVRLFYRIPYLGRHIQRSVAYTRYRLSKEREQ